MADTKLSDLATSHTVAVLYGELSLTSFGITPFDVVGTVVSKTTNYSVLAADSNTHFNNVGSSGAVTFTLPAAAAGLRYTFVVAANHAVTVAAVGLDQIALAPANSAASGNVSSSEQFDVLTLEYHTTNQWIVTSATGAWAVT